MMQGLANIQFDICELRYHDASSYHGPCRFPNGKS